MRIRAAVVGLTVGSLAGLLLAAVGVERAGDLVLVVSAAAGFACYRLIQWRAGSP